MLAALLTYTQKEADPGSSPLVTNVIGCSKTQQLTLDVLCRILQGLYQYYSQIEQCTMYQLREIWDAANKKECAPNYEIYKINSWNS